MQSTSSPSDELAAALADASALLGSSPSPSNPAKDMETILKTRLLAYYERLNLDKKPEEIAQLSTLEDLQMLTAREALTVLARVQKVLDLEASAESEAPANQVPSIGTRDLGQLRTLLSLAFKWDAEPLFARVIQAWPVTPHHTGPKIIDLTVDAEDYQRLSSLLLAVFALVFPEGAEGRIAQTLITTTILTRHITDLLLPAISLGWLPQALAASSAMPPLHAARPLVMRLLRLLTPAQAIVALGGILSATSPPPPLHTRKTCSLLLTKQLLRPEGVPGLCEAMFSAEETSSDEVKVEKLEQIAKTLNTVPANMKAQEYYPVILPRVLKLLVNEARTSYRRAAAFTVYRAISPQDPGPEVNQKYASSTILDMLHKPLLEISDTSPEQPKPDQTALAPHEALSALTILLSNTEPSPTFIPRILSPIVSALYSLLYDLDQVKTADPRLKESVTGLLVSWGKIVDEGEGSKILWSIVEGGKDGEWKVNLEGHLRKTKTVDKAPGPSLILPGQDQEEGEEDFDEDLNLFNLYPDPIHFVQLIKQIDRGDIASSLFLKLLEDYRDMKSRSNEDSMKILHKLQIIMQMQNRLSEGTTSNILRKPNQLLMFIFHVLDSANMFIQQDQGPTRVPASSNNLDEDELEEGDSDDEDPDSEVIGPDDELIETAITLLLSILEADETLSARTHPIFNDIFSKLELLALKGSSTLRPLAREARLVITARLADTSGYSKSKKKPKGDGEDAQETYQKALKLLQDPILPVRAHGLLLLRQLVSPDFAKDQEHQSVKKALLPSILSIFLQAVQDEDSYMFLNAVQGLASLVDTYGKEILQGLVKDYSGGLSGLGAGNLTQQDVDVRTRIGEALSSVIKRCGSALGLYVDLLVPPLFATVRASDVPTTLRTSSLSLLADCVDTYPLAMLPYLEDLCQAMVHLLQIESLPLRETEKKKTKSENGDEGQKEQEPSPPPPPTMDSDPTSRNSKFPPLRRAALHFLSLLIRSATKLVYDDTDINSAAAFFSKDVIRRLSLTLGYISVTDQDDVVRVMAREAKENLEGLQRAAFGI
ncbi:Transport and Golgi organization protein 6-like protein [Psilocybe cubensis]|uniref:RNA polymerase II assembly factor Rtp1 C-terminal domain-containing protein n=2 Tax=Psilocybe cubensis TaxID=181762 RepID=A0A8H7Y271_PSICU|nr:Transport and Golgi organization protein 6-like protein [Psilocybe cubensis]KAH9483052.1 Transport and Golgi organization protein 6-like protein [Psilocybe cubensis]